MLAVELRCKKLGNKACDAVLQTQQRLLELHLLQNGTNRCSKKMPNCTSNDKLLWHKQVRMVCSCQMR